METKKSKTLSNAVSDAFASLWRSNINSNNNNNSNNKNEQSTTLPGAVAVAGIGSGATNGHYSSDIMESDYDDNNDNNDLDIEAQVTTLEGMTTSVYRQQATNARLEQLPIGTVHRREESVGLSSSQYDDYPEDSPSQVFQQQQQHIDNTTQGLQQDNQDNVKQSESKIFACLVVALVFLVAIVLVFVMLVFTNDDNNQGSSLPLSPSLLSPTQAPMIVPTLEDNDNVNNGDSSGGSSSSPISDGTNGSPEEAQAVLLPYLAGLVGRFSPGSAESYAKDWMINHYSRIPYEDEDALYQLHEHFALLTLYYATGGDSDWTRKDYWLSPIEQHPTCQWYRNVDDCSTYKTTLDLSNNNLVGTIPSAILLLTRLDSIDLSNNPSLTGTLPKSLATTSTSSTSFSLMNLNLGNTGISDTSLPTGYTVSGETILP